MRSWKFLNFIAAAFLVVGCSGKSLMKADCHSCTVEEQEWDDFSWNALEGKWKGGVDSHRNVKGVSKKERKEAKVELQFLNAASFLKFRGASECKNLPEEAVVLNGQLWEKDKSLTKNEYEAFVPVEDDKVAYGRLSFEKMNGAEICSFRRLGRVMGKNRLNLPAASFSYYGSNAARGLASQGNEEEISVEFLRFDPLAAAPKAFAADGRRPSSAKEAEVPTLIIRVFKLGTQEATKDNRGEWKVTEEAFFRLWKTN